MFGLFGKIVFEVNIYNRLYEELYRLGSGGFGEVLTNYGNNIVSNISVNGMKPMCITLKWSCVPIVCRIFFKTIHKYLVDNRKNQ
ncbi:unnamed protein product [Oppiella nova]|uniref:Uncharacterized protein n=1 Tax=Oppiella nova TaxID=334625 RepID=A0A7R9MIM8_9ACAR|nr:unnamed protein product [Oppiella nova]CAG2177813.1 unnamed protein product [Oppiella nova]